MFLQSSKTCRHCKIDNIVLLNECRKQIFIESYVVVPMEQKIKRTWLFL